MKGNFAMKKLITFLASFTTITSLTANTVFADETVDVEHPIRELSKQFGSETDYFTLKNFSAPMIDNDLYNEFLKKCTNAEYFLDPYKSYSDTLRSGCCIGISILEILSHNGIISPSDIQENAQYLIDINNIGLRPVNENYDVTRKFYLYQAAQLYTEFDLYMRWCFNHYTNEERFDIMLDTAKKATDEGKYFLIVYKSDNLFHAVAGIGMIDGEWEFEGKQFDKCVITYDSNVLREDLTAWGVHDNSVIYVNSQTRDFYIPVYFESGRANNMSFFTLDDESLMNYKGAINPSEKTDIDLSELNKIMVNCKGEYSIYAEKSDGTAYDVSAESNNIFFENRIPCYYADGNIITIESNDLSAINTTITDTERTILINANGGSEKITKDASNISVESTGDEISYDISVIYNEGDYSFTPHCNWNFKGKTSSKINFKTVENGILINSDATTGLSLTINDISYDENDIRNSVTANTQNTGLTVSESVLVSFNENGGIEIFIDPDNDGVYDTYVEAGDVDCNGTIDSSDASFVLEAYAKLSTSHSFNDAEINVFEKSADYNGDGIIDAKDASDILAYYAYQSTH